MNTIVDVIRHVQQAFGIEVSLQSTWCVHCRVGLGLVAKVKKPHLSPRSIKTCLEFFRFHQH
jgi:hypothetical protein